MAEPLITIPDKILNFQLTPAAKLRHSTAFNSEFNAQALEMVEVTEKDWNITVINTQIQVADRLINFHCTNSNDSEMINFHHNASLILVTAAADNSIIVLGNFYKNGSTNRSPIFGASTSLPPITSSDTRNFPVTKLAEVEAVRIIYVPHDEETNAPVIPNTNYGTGGGPFGYGNNGDGGGDGDGDGDNNDGFGEAIPVHPMFDRAGPIRIYRIQRPSNIRSPIIFTNIFANQYRNWHALARAIYQIYLATTNQEDNLLFPPDASHCWPGSDVEYGRFEQDTFYCYVWRLHPWNSVKHFVTDVLVKRS